MEVKETFNVPLWNDQCVKRCHGVSVTYRIRERIGTHRSYRYDLAETASLRSVVVAFSALSSGVPGCRCDEFWPLQAACFEKTFVQTSPRQHSRHSLVGLGFATIIVEHRKARPHRRIGC